jgi:hypothetical protein
MIPWTKVKIAIIYKEEFSYGTFGRGFAGLPEISLPNMRKLDEFSKHHF